VFGNVISGLNVVKKIEVTQGNIIVEILCNQLIIFYFRNLELNLENLQKKSQYLVVENSYELKCIKI